MNKGAVFFTGGVARQILRIVLGKPGGGPDIEAKWGWYKAPGGTIARWARAVPAPTSAAFTMNRGDYPSDIDPYFRGSLYGVGSYAGNYDVARKRVSTGIITNNNNIASAGVRTPYSWGSDGLGESYEITVTSRRTSDPDLPAEFADYQSGGGGAFTGSPVTVTDSRNQLVKMVYYFCGWAKPRPEKPWVTALESPNHDPADPANPWSTMDRQHGPYYNRNPPGPVDPDRKPGRGYLDERLPSVIADQISLMEAAGFEVAVYQIGWSWEHSMPELIFPGVPGSPSAQPPNPNYPLPDECKPLYGHVARYHATVAPREALGRLRFCLSFFDVLNEAVVDTTPGSAYDACQKYWDARINRDGWTLATLRISLERFGQRIAPMLDSPHYYKIAATDGVALRPVFVLGGPQNLNKLASRFGLTLRQLLDEFETQMNRDFYFVATAIPDNWHDGGTGDYSLGAAGYSTLGTGPNGAGFDAHTAYLYHGNTPDYQSMRDAYEGTSPTTGRWNQHVDETPAHWVPVSAGYDPRPQCYAISSADECNPDLVQVATPTAFGQHLGAAAVFARNHHAKTAGHVIAYAWSEWSEGGIIEPMPAEPGWKYYGDEMAVAAASVT